jgi:hypothetical protein
MRKDFRNFYQIKPYNMKHLSLFLIFSLAFGPPILRAQEVVSSGGAQARSSGIALSWTLGEIAVETLSNGTLTLTQGFHQSKLSLTGIEETVTPGLLLVAYPNPLATWLNIRIDAGEFSNLEFSLLTLDGKELVKENIRKSLTQIDMQSYAAGNYLLKIRQRTGVPVKTFKVVKQ